MMVLLAFVIPQIHFSGICAPFWLMAVLYVGRKQVSYPSLICGGLLGTVIWIPWIAFQRIAGWAESKAWIEQIVSTPAAHGRAFLKSIDYLQCMLHSSNFDYWFGGNSSQWPDYFPPWQRWATGISAVLLSALLLASVVRILARTIDHPSRLLLLWITLPVLFGTLLRSGLSPQNLLIAYPIPFVLVGMMTVRLQETLRQRIRFVPIAMVVAICVMHIVFLVRCAQFVGDGRTNSDGRYQLSYRQRQATAKSILEDATTRPVTVVGEFDGWYPAYEYVLQYEPVNQNRTFNTQGGLVCYWIDEKPPTAGNRQAIWNRKERHINLSIVEYLGTAPDWEIERQWSVNASQIYRLRFLKKMPLQ